MNWIKQYNTTKKETPVIELRVLKKLIILYIDISK